MKNYVIDANVLFAALISGKQSYLDFLSRHTVYTTDFAFIEIEKYRNTILKKSKLKDIDFFDFTVKLFSRVSILPALIISTDNFEKALDLCSDIDTKDVMYIALTLQLDKSIFITRDTVLFSGLQQKGFGNIALFHQVFDS